MSSWFSWLGNSSSKSELPNIFPLPVENAAFVANDVQAIYSRILTDVLERTQGIPEEKKKLLWDNCVANEVPDGLVTLLAKAMTDKSELFIVFDRATKVLRKATPEEQAQIKADYSKGAESKVGTYITFKNYKRTDMVKLYSALEYCNVAALYKTSNLSKAIQLKMTDLRGSVALTDAARAESQAKAMAEGLAAGKDVLMDAKDIIETAKPDLTATKSAMSFINEKRSFYLGLPPSYMGETDGASLGDTGKGDARKVERGLSNYFFAIIKPVVDAVFSINSTFESDDFDQLTSALEALKTFELTSDEYLSHETKLTIVNKLFGLPPETEGDDPKDDTPPKSDDPAPPAPVKDAVV